MDLDSRFVRSQFPQAADDFVFCSNAGGSYVAKPVLDILTTFNSSLRIQPYAPFSPSRDGGELMDRARSLWAAALNIAEDELTIGPSTSANSYVLAQAIAPTLAPGDEIVVCQQDHEANHGVWRRMADAAGVVVHEWQVEPDTGLLDPDKLYALLSDKTKWVFFTHCSNLVGTTNPVVEIVETIRQQSAAHIGVDGVAHAPHHIPDLKHLDVDVYLFSLYKVYGPHQGILYVRREVGDSLEPQSHHFLAAQPSKRFNPTGPQHAEVAASAGVIDYFHALMAHHQLDYETVPLSKALQSLHALLAAYEARLASPILDVLHQSNAVQLLGKPHCNDGDRAPTIAFRSSGMSAGAIAANLQSLGIGAESGDFYAGRVLDGMGIERREGVVRLSLVHYNTEAEVKLIVDALSQTLG